MLAPHALKGQKLLAQGSALGIIAIGKAPCKGKSFMYCLDFLSFCPYRATDLRPKQPRALPWAKSFCPLPLLYPSASDFQFRYAPVTVGSGRIG